MKPTEKEIQDVQDEAQEQTIDDDLDPVERTYAEGVNDALMWALGLSDTNPMEG